jgi:dihydrofolate synthase/folylpolyglutamate synthase
MTETGFEWLRSTKQFGSKPGLEVMRELVKLLGDPQNKFKTIHVTGTNGKGTTTAIAASILGESNYKVGRFISPPLSRFSERIIVNNNEISPKHTEVLLIKLRDVTDKLLDECYRHPTFFELVTALAFLHFESEKVDVSIIEVGMGGRLDATNVIESAISVVTNVHLEHTSYLGETVQEIAWQKGGIVKEGGTLVTASNDDSVVNVLKKICNEKNASFLRVGEDIKYKIKKTTQGGSIFDVTTPKKMYNELYLPLHGEHQVINAVTAISAIECFTKNGYDVSENNVKTGLEKVQWPGRMEVVGEKPKVVLDSAKDPMAVRAAVKSLSLFDYDELITVISISSDKNIESMIEALSGVTDRFIVTEHKLKSRVAKPETIVAVIEKHHKIYKIVLDAKEAVRNAINEASKKDLVLIIGSIFLVGEVREIWYPSN